MEQILQSRPKWNAYGRKIASILLQGFAREVIRKPAHTEDKEVALKILVSGIKIHSDGHSEKIEPVSC